MDITAAVSFVESRGTGLEKARLKWILYGVAPDPWVVIALLERQYENGGFARKIGEPSTINNTLKALWQLDELGMLRSPAGDKALNFLSRIQKEDGSWSGDFVIIPV